jgi:predicted glycoside hydrolase/deacetylase ChbG (UPF0249 family)
MTRLSSIGWHWNDKSHRDERRCPPVLIVNADDFGLSPAVNGAILDAFDRGLVSSTTVMAVMPGFDEAAELAVERGLQQHVGVHLVLSEGLPLTDPILGCRRFCDAEGSFRPRRERGPVVRLSAGERDAVSREIAAQVAACRSRGLPVTHLDSHQQIHTEIGLWPLVVRLAPQLAIPFVRPARASRDDVSPTAKLNRALFNRALGRAGLAATRHFGDVDDYRRLRSRGLGASELRDLELMTHPEHDEHGKLVDYHCADAGADLARLLAEVEGVCGAVSFAGARYRKPGCEGEPRVRA